MLTYSHKVLIDQIVQLSGKLGGPFPYEDCRVLIAQLRESASPRSGRQAEDLIPDLDAYFYLVESHSGGAAKLTDWPTSELTVSRALLKNSFFQAHTKYRNMEWMINEINTPRLYLMLTVSNELRTMLLKLIFDLVEESKRVNLIRQDELLLA